MSNTKVSDAPVIEPAELLAWSEQVRALHAEATKPFIEDDPRLVILEAALGMSVDRDEWGDEFLLGQYFMKYVELPKITMVLPGWVERVEYRLGSYPCVNVGLRSKRFTHGNQYAEIEQWLDIFVEDYDTEFDGCHPAGHVQINEPVIQTEKDEYSISVALGMINTMDEAVEHLRENS
ncbi:hypothetical protein BH09ACT6_BH09ACT6_05930 [soil metagenome]